jgi:hypothetical protein
MKAYEASVEYLAAHGITGCDEMRWSMHQRADLE